MTEEVKTEPTIDNQTIEALDKSIQSLVAGIDKLSENAIRDSLEQTGRINQLSETIDVLGQTLQSLVQQVEKLSGKSGQVSEKSSGVSPISPAGPASKSKLSEPASAATSELEAELADICGLSINFRDAEAACDLFRQATVANRDSQFRDGSTDWLPEQGRVIMTGDLHDNTLNLRRIMKLAELDESPDHHVILHEVIHGPDQIDGRDMSIITLMRIAALKVRYPDQLHLMQSNHELSQAGQGNITKDGKSVVDAFDKGVDHLFGGDADEVRKQITRFIFSYPLAVRCPKGILFSHSLPSPRQLGGFDTTILDRKVSKKDYDRGNSAYSMVWGRDQNEDVVESLRFSWGVKWFVTGHQPAPFGHEVAAGSVIILASDHSHGVAMPLDLAKDYDFQGLLDAIIPLNSIEVD
jgi:hypothetical protein